MSRPILGSRPAERRPSRQALWQQRQRQLGRCPQCGAPTDGWYYCEKHREAERKRQRKAWKGWKR